MIHAFGSAIIKIVISVGDWCSGNTGDSGSPATGSTPVSPASLRQCFNISRFVDNFFSDPSVLTTFITSSLTKKCNLHVCTVVSTHYSPYNDVKYDETMLEKDYYKILQVDPHAEQEVIEGAYKRLAFKYHPDRYKGSDSDERMKQINDAYDTLRDPVKRVNYDESRFEQHSSCFYEDKPFQHSNSSKRESKKVTLFKLSLAFTLFTAIVVSGYYIVEKARGVSDLIDENTEQNNWDQLNQSPGSEAILAPSKLQEIPRTTPDPFPPPISSPIPSPEIKTLKANVSISNLTVSPKTVILDNPVTVTVTMKNTSESFKSHQLTLTTSYGVSETRDIPLSPGETRLITFNLTKNTVGTYTVEIEGLKSSFTVQNRL